MALFMNFSKTHEDVLVWDGFNTEFAVERKNIK